MINNVVLVGRLTKDPDLRYTANGVAVATFTLAVNRTFTNQNGEREADFVNCVIWRKAAENLANLGRKGALIGATGRIQTRNYENQQGQRVFVTEVVADNFQLLEPRSVTEQRRSSDNDSGSGNQPNFGDNYNQNQASQSSETSNFDRDNTDPFGGSSIDISDDDLPF
ncbi:single-stranded DNA-binding protein [Tetragenococcus muriaticus]|uniref:Single-stranded DNA-binding protein n=2 Tax=Tetragenococcus muriaticus TaxID=64642 RepID=A0A091BZB2_9ENTE|nr:single-stranded DNA-binding protein [Tetragenococcus muriaticus]KFN89147.1 single-stranded DNA-binding protein [Tetragenococcus muriaticus 3MR10-3]KFN89376.1 single-stranded DNA-binding protein [Tetragenococcus muriaticus PMC-11-5]GMA48201.1 single-stranded DNA-binding protein [Tetragenococcus muriaticus]